VQLRRLLGDHLELVRNLGELAARRRQVRRGRAKITLQLRHPRLKHRLLVSGGLGGVPGGGLGSGRSSIGPFSGLLCASLDASESCSVAAVAAAVSAVVARSSAD
jgi:hypothetical protein